MSDCICGGRGYCDDPDEPRERYCTCPAGDRLCIADGNEEAMAARGLAVPHIVPDRSLVRVRHEDGTEDVADLIITHPMRTGIVRIE